jgi:predicted Rossmann fold flavoprotein
MPIASMPAGNSPVVVIGGGPAGMTAALFALRAGVEVLLLEKNEKLGKKLYITGKGRCNVTNATTGEDFLQNVPRNPRFLFSALHFLDSGDLRMLLHDLGCPTVVERGQRVFPTSQKASDVTKALIHGLAGAKIRLNTAVQGLEMAEDRCTGVLLTDGQRVQAGAVIVATGGLSYAVTGSTGDGYRFAVQSGHRLTARHPSLVPIETEDLWARPLQGLTLKNVCLDAFRGKKRLFSEQGELLFTHFGISGPLVLSLSSSLAGLDVQQVQAFIDLKPAVSAPELDKRLSDELSRNGRRQLKSLLPGYLPGKLAEMFPEACPVNFQKTCSQVTAAERTQVIATMKALPIRLKAFRSFNEAVITRGGVDLRDVDPGTMASRLSRGLYFAGEVLDVDGLTGGFNLQIAFSTGALAGHSAANYRSRSV